jgi:ribosomal protein L32
MDYLRIEPNKTVLVLNSSYEPINLTNWRRAVVLLMKNKAQVLSNRVIRLLNYVKIPMTKIMANKPSRSSIYKRDHNICQYCGSTRNLTIDHVIPKSRGGKDTWENLVTACYPCNIKKGSKLLSETTLTLSKLPSRPFNKIMLDLNGSNVDEWMEYCFR